MKKNIFSMLVAMVLCLFMMACSGGGGGESTTSAPSQTVTPAPDPTPVPVVPATVAEVSAAFDAAPEVLQSYFYEIEKFGKSSNPDTVATSTEFGAHLLITYEGAEIYSETHGWGIYMGHGFMKDGTYVILLREYDAGSYGGKNRLFVDGKEIFLSLQYPISDIKEFENGWLIFLCQNGSARTGVINKNWTMFNLCTAELKQFGDYGTFTEQTDARHRVTIYPGQEAVVVPVWGDNQQIVNLVLNGDGTQAIYAANAVKVYFNYQCGWHVAGGNALEAPYGATTFIEGIPTSAQFLISIIDKDGLEYTLNPDFADVFLSDGTKIEFDKVAGVYKYGDQSDVALSCK